MDDFHNPKGLRCVFNAVTGVTKQNKFLQIQTNFKDTITINPVCLINDGIKEMGHFLLLCNTFREHRRNLLAAGVSGVLEVHGYSVPADNNILQLLLHGFAPRSQRINSVCSKELYF